MEKSDKEFLDELTEKSKLRSYSSDFSVSSGSGDETGFIGAVLFFALSFSPILIKELVKWIG